MYGHEKSCYCLQHVCTRLSSSNRIYIAVNKQISFQCAIHIVLLLGKFKLFSTSRKCLTNLNILGSGGAKETTSTPTVIATLVNRAMAKTRIFSD